ncbi:unnamed protein product [Prorocentrum cordatum]|uniref:Uncharacterized protein n=1 Tax=Prorocentrum cordatum TaxID=2364126 RepID=A0ABN9QF45_9DINO|nr:unnamed protein product [Polarella glacialis]
MHFGVPRGSWSRARDAPPGPPPLRSIECVMGLADLSAKDQAKVDLGNCMMSFSVSCLHVCRRMRISGAMGNPATSRIWLAPAVVSLARSPASQVVATDFCQFGTPWGKRAKFLGALIDLSSIEKLCKRKNNVCSASQRLHLNLQGKNSEGRFWTEVAEPCPPRLCLALALAFSEAPIALKAQGMARHL